MFVNVREIRFFLEVGVGVGICWIVITFIVFRSFAFSFFCFLDGIEVLRYRIRFRVRFYVF